MAQALDDLPVTRIRPPKGWISLDLGEMWQYRDLLYFLTWRDVKVKYKQALLGFAWAVIVPLANMFIFGLVFGRIAQLETDGVDPYLFYLAGLVPWQYFAGSITMSSNSLVAQANLLTKIYLPRIFIPLGTCLANFVDFAIAFIILLAMMFCMRIVPAATILVIPPLMLGAFATAIGVGLLFSALNVKYRDVKFVVPFLIQMWMYCTVTIPYTTVAEKLGTWRYVYGLNPMAAVVEGTRWCLLHHEMTKTTATDTILEGSRVPETLASGQEVLVRTLEDQSTQLVLREVTKSPVDMPWELFWTGLPTALVLLLFGLYYFKRMERMFADVV